MVGRVGLMGIIDRMAMRVDLATGARRTTGIGRRGPGTIICRSAHCSIYVRCSWFRIRRGLSWRLDGTFIHAFLELADAATQALHQLGKLAPEQQEANEQDDEPMGATRDIEETQYQSRLDGHGASRQRLAG